MQLGFRGAQIRSCDDCSGMIVKRTMIADAPNLKRCKIDGTENAIQKKCRVNGLYSRGVSGDAEYFSSGSSSWSSEGSYRVVVVRFSRIRILFCSMGKW